MTALKDRYDWVIVGSGGGSMCAALAAKRLGKEAVILEKQSKVGGSTGFSGGVWWVPNNLLLARAGVHDSYELGRKYVDAVVGPETPATSAARRDAFLRTAPKMIEFLEAVGMKLFWPDGWSDYHDNLPGGQPRGRSIMADPFNIKELGEWAERLSTYKPFRSLPVSAEKGRDLGLIKRSWVGKRAALNLAWTILSAKLTGKDIVTNGAAIQGRMLQIALREGIPIFPDTPVTDLLVEGGRVVGVKVMHDGKELEVRGDNVLLDSGGFARNAQLREQYQRNPQSATNANHGDTGEVMQMAMRLGAATESLDAAVWVTTSRSTNGTWPEGSVIDGEVFPPMHNFDISKPHNIMVDGLGERFVNEATSYVTIGERMYQRQQETGRAVPTWMIMDSRFIKWYGIGATPPGVTPKQWYDSGYLRKAATLEALAADCGIDAAGLKRTVERFNGFAARGVDEDFGRGEAQYDKWRGDPKNHPNPSLGSIAEPPFYAVSMYPGDVGTTGGLLTDEYARVLRSDGSAIPGLFATGNCAASPFGHTYPGAGASIANSFTFGYIAVQHVGGKS